MILMLVDILVKEVYEGLCHTSIMEHFAKKSDGFSYFRNNVLS